MNLKGIPVSRWIDGVLEDKDNIDQPDNVRGDGVLGACSKLTDPYEGNEDGNGKARHHGRDRSISRLFPRCCPTVPTVFTCYRLRLSTRPTGHVTASNRSLQWREKVIEPSFDSLPDHVIMYKFAAKKFGFADRMFRNITVERMKSR